jgi:hypothetical protein
MSGEEAEGRERKAANAPGAGGATPADSTRDPAPCDVCGVPALIWRKCKLVCENCGSINKSCADL